MRHRAIAYASVLALAGLILFSGDTFASGPRRLWVSDRHGRLRAYGVAVAYDRDPAPADPCVGSTPDGQPCPPADSSGATAGTSASSGTTATTGTSTTGTSSSTGDSSGTTSGPPTGPPGGSTTGSPPGPPGGPPTNPTTGTTTTATAGTDSGGTPDPGPPTTSGGGGWSNGGGPPTIDGATENGYVSGTKVEAHFPLALSRPADSPYTQVFVKSVDLTIGSEVDSTWNVPLNQTLTPDGDGKVNLSVPVRFASTRFGPKTTVGLTATFNCTLSSADGTVQTDQAYATDVLHVITYNRGLAWKTMQIANNDVSPPSYQTVIPPIYPEYNWDSPHAIDDPGGAVATLSGTSPGTGLNHDLVPGGTTLKGAPILAGMKQSTAILAYTHGNADQSFLTSWGDVNDDNGSFDSRVLSFVPATNSDVSHAVGDARVEAGTNKPIPPVNLAILHACSVGASGYTLARALGILGTQQVTSTNDRACCGFPEVVYSRLYDGNGGRSVSRYLSEHAQRIYADLAQGQTIKQSVDDANLHCTPAKHVSGDQFDKMFMNYKGDVYMRLIGVYTGSAANAANPLLTATNNFYPYRWYLVNP